MMVLVDLRIVNEGFSDFEQMTTQRRKKEHDNAGDGADEDSESAYEARLEWKSLAPRMAGWWSQES